MNILLINHEFPPFGGGAANAAANLAREFVKLGHKVLVMTAGARAGEEQQNGFKILRVSKRKRIDGAGFWEMFKFIFWSIWRKNSVVDFNSDMIIAFFGLPAGFIAWRFKKAFGAPYIVSLRGADVPGFMPVMYGKYHSLTLWLTKIVWKNAKAVVANSRGLMELAQKTAEKIGVKVGIIPNGVNVNFFWSAAEKEKMGKFKILFVGRLTSQKGADTLLRSIGELINRGFGDKIECEIVGDGPLCGELEALAKDLGIGSVVTFSGWLDRNKLPEEYRSADVFVLPSADEGMPNVILEAMASGLPVIATRISGNEELVKDGENGYLVPPKDASALADKIELLINNKNLSEELGKKSLELARKYSWEGVARRYLD